MSHSTPKTLQELHRIREQIAKEQAGVPVEERLKRVQQESDALLKEWHLNLKRVSPPSSTTASR